MLYVHYVYCISCSSFYLVFLSVLFSAMALRKVVTLFGAMLQLAMAKDPEAAFFKRLEGLQPCEVSELKPGTHIFAVYGLDNLLLHILFALMG